MYGTIHVYNTVYVTVHSTVHIDGLMTWHWPMMWHWLMRCHDPIGLKFLCTVDRWRGSISVDKKSHVRYMQHRIIFNQTASLFTRVKPCYCSSAWSNRVLFTRTVDWWRGAILSVQTVFNPMAMIYSMYL